MESRRKRRREKDFLDDETRWALIGLHDERLEMGRFIEGNAIFIQEEWNSLMRSDFGSRLNCYNYCLKKINIPHSRQPRCKLKTHFTLYFDGWTNRAALWSALLSSIECFFEAYYWKGMETRRRANECRYPYVDSYTFWKHGSKRLDQSRSCLDWTRSRVSKAEWRLSGC